MTTSDRAALMERLKRRAENCDIAATLDGVDPSVYTEGAADYRDAAVIVRTDAATIARLTAALAWIAEEHDAGRHDGLPEPCPAHEADAMFAIARAALSGDLPPDPRDAEIERLREQRDLKDDEITEQRERIARLTADLAQARAKTLEEAAQIVETGVQPNHAVVDYRRESMAVAIRALASPDAAVQGKGA